jgi:hypothetical protein
MKVRCPGCEAVFDTNLRSSSCPHRLIIGYFPLLGSQCMEFSAGPGWCAIHAAWDCQEMHGDPSEA